MAVKILAEEDQMRLEGGVIPVEEAEAQVEFCCSEIQP